MEYKKILILAIIIIICAAIVSGVAIMSFSVQSETELNILSNSSLYNGENVTVKLTTDNGTPVVNQSVNVTLIDASGNRNTLNLVTNDQGIASFTLGGVAVGNYTLDCIFGGSDDYKESNITSSLEIKQEVVEQKTKQTTKSSSGYGDYDKTEFTGQYDSEGKPIYRSVHSQSNYGGQYINPGVYEEYWSENGPISGGKIK